MRDEWHSSLRASLEPYAHDPPGWIRWLILFFSGQPERAELVFFVFLAGYVVVCGLFPARRAWPLLVAAGVWAGCLVREILFTAHGSFTDDLGDLLAAPLLAAATLAGVSGVVFRPRGPRAGPPD